ncbi:hypothetical protein AVEN_113911-1 [Araneus ventricosus]|uniref:Uncharacterized protein n=1 Tax=Araneus ventricosus TaxID=182803 RepID=A0A4Y2LEM0_ARAVE|nr:hypothetical protein AVEN_113911-1 [Araneus ventricosus]
MVADIVSDVSRPSTGLLTALTGMIEGASTDPGVTGTLTISLGHLASKAAPEGKDKVSEVFTNLLHERQNGCELDPSVMNVLEGIGNLKSDRVAVDVMEVSKLCRNNSTVQIACAHALRHSSHLPCVQQWIQNVTTEGDCELLSEIVASLADTVQDQEMTPDDTRWPRFGFNAIDSLLKDHLGTSSCSHEEIVLYFRRKKNADANEIAEKYFEPESEPWNPRSGSRQKRSAWDDLNCQDWTEDSKFVTIQDREEFATDRATYNRRKSCLGFKKLGIKGANAEIYAGVFAGVKEPSSPPKYKLFTKFVSQLNFLGQELQIGSFRFYHQNGKMNANVKIMGRTRQEFTHDGCTPTDLTYRPLKHVPLFNVNIGIAQLSLGVQISSQLGIITSCPGAEEYVLEPLTNVRVGGEALGTVLFMRGAANLGGSFNYKLQFTFTPSPDMCLKGSHGYDPMNISFETYYQLWNKLKDDWGRVRTWKPGYLSWNITRGDIKPWFKDTCIAPKASSDPFSNSERELE